MAVVITLVVDLLKEIGKGLDKVDIMTLLFPFCRLGQENLF